MGKTISPFDAPWTNYPGNNFDGLVGGSGTVTAVNQLTYDAQFGNGVSGTLALVDPTAYNQSNLFNLGAVAANGLGLIMSITPSLVPPMATTTLAVRGSPTSSVESRSTKPGVCSRSRLSPTTITLPTTRPRRRSRPYQVPNSLVLPRINGVGPCKLPCSSRPIGLLRVTP